MSNEIRDMVDKIDPRVQKMFRLAKEDSYFSMAEFSDALESYLEDKIKAILQKTPRIP